MSKKRTLEEVYFHIHNGGMVFRIVETTSERESPQYAEPVPNESGAQLAARLANPISTQTMVNRRWYFEVRLSSFGSGTSFRFPLGNPTMIKWMIDALTRVLARMEKPQKEPSDGFEYAFRDGKPVRITRQDGRAVEINTDELCAQSTNSEIAQA
jgi:hypothetical protein